MHSPDDTIVAVSTPPGRGAIALVRLSGPAAIDCARRVFGLSPNDRIEHGRAALGRFRDPMSGETIDEGYMTCFMGPRSYTGEDVAELSCHGSPVILTRMVEALLQAGAVAAEPGEFSYRAVVNGRLDLAQAEGVRDLINASTAEAARVARGQLRGDLSRRVQGIRDQIIDAVSRAEAGIEFGEEPDLAGASADLAGRVSAIEASVGAFLSTYRRGRLLREGACVVIAGRPNAGKSSLFNRLLRTDRAIVSEEPGTTRDFISERIDLDGIPVTLHDTAGLRAAAQGVEGEGIDRARRLIDEADLALILCPADEIPDDADRALIARCEGRAILLASKSDLAPAGRPAWGEPVTPAVSVSAVTGAGVASLRDAIVGALGWPTVAGDGVVLTDARHHEALRRCAERLSAARGALEAGSSEEIPLVDLHAALGHLGEITGDVTREAIYDRIFETFCIGK